LYTTHEFLLLIVGAIVLSKVFPQFGVQYLHPKITADYIAVLFIFLLSGLGLQTCELQKAIYTNFYFNMTIQCFSFFFVSGYVYVVSHYVLYRYHIIQNRHLCDGMIICSCLAMAINSVIVINKSSRGDDAAALFNCAFGNLLGVFLSPFLILLYIGIQGTMDLVDIFFEISVRVLLPVLVGLVLQRSVYVQERILSKYKPIFKQLQQYCLAFIVYTVFCATFVPKDPKQEQQQQHRQHSLSSSSSSSDEMVLSTMDVLTFAACQITILISIMIMAWFLSRYLFPQEPQLRVMGFVGCTSKTIAVGVPLIHAMYASTTTTSPELVALYTLPLLIHHPTQLIIGTLLAPYLADFVDRELLRLEQQQATTPATTAMIINENTSLLAAQKV
jgi:solute carrier family 10 (sodium/bile acid cotransporter), member 7